MNNMWLIFRRDVANLFKNVMSVIITVGLIVMPSLFAWYNILACWDVFENTGGLSVAVASDDKGFESDLVPININVGEKVVSALRANDQIGWVFTDSEDAVEGTKSGKYYAALVIPEDFSRQMLTFYEGKSQSANIKYYVNKKKNAISPNITGTGADTVSAQVNSTFAGTLSEVAAAVASGLGKYVHDGDVSERVGLLSNRLQDMADRLDQSADVLALYSTLAKDSKGLLKSSSDLVASAKKQAGEVASGIDADKQAIRDLADRLGASLDALVSSVQGSASSLSELEGWAQALADDASANTANVANDMRGKAAEVDDRCADLGNRLSELEELRDELQSGIGPEIDRTISRGDREAELSVDVKVAVEQTVVLDKCIALLSKTIDVLQEASADLTQAASDLEAGNADVQDEVSSLLASISQAKADAESMAAEFDATVQPGIEKLKGDLEKLVADLDEASSTVSSLGSDMPAVASQVGDALDKASGKVDDACKKLHSSADSMRNLSDSINLALDSGDTETLRSLLSGNIEELATALSAPVQVDREAIFPVENFGSAMAPLYCTLALFIGSLIIMVAMKPTVSERGRAELKDPKPRQLYLGHFGVVAVVSLLQTTVLGLGTMLFLKVQVANPLLFMTAFWIGGLVFVFMIYTLVVAFENLGKAIAVIMLIVQVTACGGSYPLPILPGFVQAISPFVPATHVVNALRAAMFGVYQNDFWIAIGCLLLFVIPFLLLGLLLRKPLERFMRFYVRKVEESKLV